MEQKKKQNRFLLWRTDFVGIVMFVSGILLLLNNFDILPGNVFVSKTFLIDRIIGILFLIIGIGFLFFQGAGGGLFWLIIPAGCFLTFGIDILIVDLNHLFSLYSLSFFFTGLGITFILLFLFQKNHWWALIPSGVLLGSASYFFISQLDSLIRYHPILILIGLSISFITIYLFSYQKEKMKWSLLTGLIIFSASLLYFVGIILFHWQVLLPFLIILLGVSLFIFIMLSDSKKKELDVNQDN
jgi:hypothetical protein